MPVESDWELSLKSERNIMTNTSKNKNNILYIWGWIIVLAVAVIFPRQVATAGQAPVPLGAATIMLQTGLTLEGSASARKGAVNLDSDTVGLRIPADISPPTVSATDPVNAATGVVINGNITVTFSEAMDPATITKATFALMKGSHPEEGEDEDGKEGEEKGDGPGRGHDKAGKKVAGKVSYAGVTATFTPAGNLEPNTVYTANVRHRAKDLAGHALASDFVWSFTTAARDTTRPTVSATDPVARATDMAINGKIAVTFSEAMDPATITKATFTLMKESNPKEDEDEDDKDDDRGRGHDEVGKKVAGKVSYAGVTATFIPAGNLAPRATYTDTITTRAKALAGNALASKFVWGFTTGAALETIPPTVSSVIPANAANGVPISGGVAITFSEAMDNSTIIAGGTFTLKRGITSVAGTVTSVGASATFTPLSSLAPNTTYTATMTTAARDLAGNPLATDFASSFTTDP